jgi:O-methyltransferase involved in polyketide biosynthesis
MAWRGALSDREAISQTLEFIAAVPESEVVFDYAEPFENYPEERRASIMAVAESAAARGEPWLSLFDPAEVADMLREAGFAVIEDLGMAALGERFYGTLKKHIRIGPGAHVVRTRR